MKREVKTVGKQTAKDKVYPRLTLTGQLEELGIEPGDEVFIEVRDGVITIKPRR